MRERNAVITKVRIGDDDHGSLTMVVELDYGGTCQGFGTYSLYQPKFKTVNYCGLFIWRCLQIAGVENVNDMKGKTIRVRQNDDRMVEAIGHIVKDDWFAPTKEFEEYLKTEKELH